MANLVGHPSHHNRLMGSVAPMPKTIPYIMVKLLDMAKCGPKHFIVRMDPDDYPDLKRASTALGLKPAELARTLIVYGCRAIISEIEK